MKRKLRRYRHTLVSSIIISISAGLLSTLSSTAPAFALLPAPALTANTNKYEFAANEAVVVSGYVMGELFNSAGRINNVTIQVFDPAGKLYLNATANLDSINDYSYRFEFKDNDTKGEYQILVTYYVSQAVKIINYGPNTLGPDDFHTYVVKIDNNDSGTTSYHTIRYKVSEGVKLNSIMVSPTDMNILLNESEPTGDRGQLTIELPRSILDSRQDNGMDKAFDVSVGRWGASSEYTDAFKEIQSSAESRTLVIDLLGSPAKGGNNITEVGIVGTHIVPEFSSIFILAVLIAATVSVSKVWRVGKRENSWFFE